MNRPTAKQLFVFVPAYFILILAVLAFLPAASGADWPTIGAQVQAPPPGTLFATKNAGGDAGNPSPGEWNHVAIMGTNGWVIEAQAGHGVIACPFDVFYLRYPEVVCFRPKQTPPQLGPAVASAAAAQLGRPYKKVGNNCVSVARRAVEFVTMDKPRWRRPDHVVADAAEFYWRKNEPDTPTLAEPFEGETKNPLDLFRPRDMSMSERQELRSDRLPVPRLLDREGRPARGPE